METNDLEYGEYTSIITDYKFYYKKHASPRETNQKLYVKDGKVYTETIKEIGVCEGENNGYYYGGEKELLEECVFKNGKIEGEYKAWHRLHNGVKEFYKKFMFKDGNLEGYAETWFGKENYHNNFHKKGIRFGQQKYIKSDEEN